MPSVDVIIPTHNRPEPLLRCLDSLTEQTLTDFRVIVVDDASEPPVTNYLRAEDYPSLRLELVRLDENGGPAAARNAGLDRSEADYIAFVDDDVQAEPHLLQRHLSVVESPEDRWVVSIGPMAASPLWRPNVWGLWEWRSLRHEYERMVAGEYRPTWRQFHTGNAMAPRAAIVAAGGFDPEFRRAEDIELGVRLDRDGCGFFFTPSALVWHFPDRSFSAWRAIARAYGRFDVKIDQEHPELQWLERLNRERKRRHPLLRVAKSLFRWRPLRAIGERGASGSARLFGWMGIQPLSLAALSASYELNYESGLNEA